MKIIFDAHFIQHFHPGHERKGTEVDHCIIHYPGYSSTKALLDGWKNAGGSWAEQLKEGIRLYPYIVDLDGSITQILDTDRYYWNSKLDVWLEPRCFSICRIAGTHTDHATPEQYRAIKYIIDKEKEKWPGLKQICGHGAARKWYFKSDDKCKCPGKGFSWEMLAEELKASYNVGSWPEWLEIS